MLADKIVFCDTGFMIRLLDETNELHENAIGYFRYLLQNGFKLKMSTISVAEYCVRGEVQDLPLRAVMLLPFNVNHAVQAGNFANILFEEKSKGVFKVDHRIIIQNDVKMMAQAQCENASCYLTFDSASKRMYDVLRSHGLLSYEFYDAHITYTERFGILQM